MSKYYKPIKRISHIKSSLTEIITPGSFPNIAQRFIDNRSYTKKSETRIERGAIYLEKFRKKTYRVANLTSEIIRRIM